MNVPVFEVPVLSEASRAEIRSITSSRRRTREVRSRLMQWISPISLLVAAAPLFALLAALVSKGGPYLTRWSFYTQGPQAPTILTPNAVGGISTAITGSLSIVFWASLLAIPLGVATGIYTAEKNSRLATAIRLVAGTMSGAPSILMGLFALGLMIETLGVQASAFDGAVALAVLMLPVVAIATEIAVRAVPSTYREAGLALGAKPHRVSLKVILPAARGAIVSASLLALSRAVGETAPIIFVIGEVNRVSFNPLSPVQAMPALLYSNLASPFPALRDEAWGIGLLLVLFVFALSFTARLWAARSDKGR